MTVLETKWHLQAQFPTEPKIGIPHKFLGNSKEEKKLAGATVDENNAAVEAEAKRAPRKRNSRVICCSVDSRAVIR